jgi:hypothetical protein
MPDKPVIFLAFANDKQDNARYLRQLPIEAQGIRQALHEAEIKGICEVVERANASIQQILDVFTDSRYQNRIAVFHYGGHADGYQLLLETLLVSSVANRVAYAAGLVSFLARQKGLKLVFFNGCTTEQQSKELIAAGLPAVVGTNSAINDEVATLLAIRFYHSLGRSQPLARAWQDALDNVNIAYNTQNIRGLYREDTLEKNNGRLPWELHLNPNDLKIATWQLGGITLDAFAEKRKNDLLKRLDMNRRLLEDYESRYDLADDPKMLMRYEGEIEKVKQSIKKIEIDLNKLS